jgi:hypothetical protein
MVILEVESIDVLHRTHGSDFSTPAELLAALRSRIASLL